MQKAVYRIRFVSGELSGRTFLIPPDGILIGKSRSAAIRPGDEEIGIEHASLRYDEKGALVLEALAEKVAVRGTPLEPKAECRLEPGSDVKSVHFFRAIIVRIVEAIEKLKVDVCVKNVHIFVTDYLVLRAF